MVAASRDDVGGGGRGATRHVARARDPTPAGVFAGSDLSCGCALCTLARPPIHVQAFSRERLIDHVLQIKLSRFIKISPAYITATK